MSEAKAFVEYFV